MKRNRSFFRYQLLKRVSSGPKPRIYATGHSGLTARAALGGNVIMPAISRGRPTAEQAADMENRLLDAAWSVLIEGGPENLTIEKVAARAICWCGG
jgi:hypothetical protein